MPLNLDDGTRSTLLIHYYRAMVGRADIWRVRMDTTTNWSIGTTAAVLSFALGNPSSPHYVVHFASFLTVIFLLLEARRLTFYHLWQRRVLILERELIQPAATSAGIVSLEALEGDLAQELGTTVPSMSLGKAAARRLRRVYVYLFAAQLFAWVLKLSSDPEPARSIDDVIAHAAIGRLPGEVILGLSVLAFAIAGLFAFSRGAASRKGADSQ